MIKVSLTQATADGIIEVIEDLSLKLTQSPLCFEYRNADAALIPTATPASGASVLSDCKRFEFNEVAKELKVYDSRDQLIHTSSTNGVTVKIRVDFSNQEISVW